MWLGERLDCMKIITETTKGLCHRNRKGAAKHYLILICWFALKRLEESAMDVGADMLGMVKRIQKYYVEIT